MVNLAQVIKDLRAERSRAQKEVERLEKAMVRTYLTNQPQKCTLVA